MINGLFQKENPNRGGGGGGGMGITRGMKEIACILHAISLIPPEIPLSAGEVEPPTKFSKRGVGLDRTSTFRGGLLRKRKVTFFRGVVAIAT